MIVIIRFKNSVNKIKIMWNNVGIFQFDGIAARNANHLKIIIFSNSSFSTNNM